MDKMELKALGKINLGLDVLGRRGERNITMFVWLCRQYICMTRS